MSRGGRGTPSGSGKGEPCLPLAGVLLRAFDLDSYLRGSVKTTRPGSTILVTKWLRRGDGMTPQRIAEIERKALAFLAEGAHVPLDVYRLARSLGLSVLAATFENPALAGAVGRQGNGGIIYVNRFDGIARQRFTMAHELGHWALHLQPGQGIQDMGEQVAFRTKPEGDTPETEREANRFAAALLMPAPWVNDAITRYGENVRSLAPVFGVSETAMAIRLREIHEVSSAVGWGDGDG